MITRISVSLGIVFLLRLTSAAQQILIPMDLSQTDHLKAYGVAFWVLEHGADVEWLLNYRGGSFLINDMEGLRRECRVRGVQFEAVDGAGVTEIYAAIEQGNMEVILLEKAPKVAIYTPPNKQPWDDAVTLALEYAEIPYETLWDKEVLEGRLGRYDWLHLHHEDFTGQYGKFYASYRNAQWYIEQQMQYEEFARRLGFSKVSEQKKAVARAIKRYTLDGGFVFAMCSATDTYDIALSAEGVDITDIVYDGDPAEPNVHERLDYSRTFAFTDFRLIMDPLVYEFSDIDIPPSNVAQLRPPEMDYFSLFDFSAKYDPVPSMLTQNHVSVVKGFMGQTTAFRRSSLKDHVLILGEKEGTEEVKYIHGNAGKGTFTFLGGHDPEDRHHFVNDPPTNLALHPQSPGYRLILNNILFPAARKKPRKT